MTAPLIALSHEDHLQKMKLVDDMPFKIGAAYAVALPIQGWVASIVRFISRHPNLVWFEFHGDSKRPQLLSLSYGLKEEDQITTYTADTDTSDTLVGNMIASAPEDPALVTDLLHSRFFPEHFDANIKTMLEKHFIRPDAWDLPWPTFLERVRNS